MYATEYPWIHAHARINTFENKLILKNMFFTQACDDGLEQKKLCWVGGIPDGAGPSLILTFQANAAGAAGGAVYTVRECVHACMLAYVCE